MTDLHNQSATALVAALKAKQVGARELLAMYRSRVDELDGALNAIVVRDFDRAEARAAAIDDDRARGVDVGPLYGLPMTVKESFNVEGLVTCWGLPDLDDNVAADDAVVVERFLDAGAVIFGKTNVPVMLADWQSFNPVYGVTNNPWDLGRTPGGSSGGSSAALAAGLTGLEFGSDIAGSIRVPAHFCGLYGLKPTLDLIPNRGHTNSGSVGSVDLAVVGPLARHAEDLELALDIAAGPDLLQAAGWRLDLPREPRQALADFRVAVWPETAVAPTDRVIADRLQAVADRLSELGATVSDGARPALEEGAAHELYMDLLYPIFTLGAPPDEVAAAKAAAPELDPTDRSPEARYLRSLTMTHQDWILASEAREKLRYRWAAFFAEWDVLLCPVFAAPAYPHQHGADRSAWRIEINGAPHMEHDCFFWPGLTTVVGLPSVAAPVGRSPSGLPIGLQIVVPNWHERRAIKFARLLADEFGGFTPPPRHG